MTAQGHRRRGLVRPHTVSGPRNPDLDDAVLVQAADPAPSLAGLDAHAYGVMRLLLPADGGPPTGRVAVLSVAEVAVHIELPGAVAKKVVAALVNTGHLTTHMLFAPTRSGDDTDVLRRILRALEKI